MKRYFVLKDGAVVNGEGGDWARYEDVPQWISVEDRLPEDRQPVLCWLAMDIQGYHFWQYMVTQFANGRFHTHEDVTHWQPLPDPPGEDKDDSDA
ncbi:MAG: DUF551 domain-containing protein [Actinomycetia bacterium]|nr:DUF551 domain-containing protein [Actinomycetes bacterium]